MPNMSGLDPGGEKLQVSRTRIRTNPVAPAIFCRPGLLARISGAATAVVLLGHYLPLLPALLGTFGVVLLALGYQFRIQRRRFQSLQVRVSGIREGIEPDLRITPKEDLDSLFYKTSLDMAATLEKAYYKLAEKNVQLLSLKEIGRSIITTIDDEKIVDVVTEFLNRGLGFKEIVLVLFHPEQRRLKARILIDRGVEVEEISQPFEEGDLGGVLLKAMRARHSTYIRDARMHPLTVAGEKHLLPESTMTSYAIVPLLKGSARTMQKMGPASEEAPSDDPAPCADPGRRPVGEEVLGVLAVTDGFRARTVSTLDLITVETLAAHLATALENWGLYADLKEAERFREDIIDCMFDGLLAVDERGRVTLVNSAARKQSGYDVAEILGTRVDRLIVTQDETGGSGASPILETLEQKTATFAQEARLLRKDGKAVPIRLNCSLLYNEKREVYGALGVFNDLTRVKKMEEEILNLDKLAALGRLASSVAHEIRNPLSGIAAGIQYLDNYGDGKPLNPENTEFILGEVKRLDRIVDSLFKVARPQKLLRRPVPVEDVVERSLLAVADAVGDGRIEVTKMIESGMPYLFVDADQIQQVLVNLLKNSVESIPGRGRVSVHARLVTPEDEDYLPEIGGVSDIALVAVADDGGGMTEELRNRIFEPFFTTKNKGTGLGLYVSRSIVERHGGQLRVESREGKGTTFTLYIPIEGEKVGKESQLTDSAGR